MQRTDVFRLIIETMLLAMLGFHMAKLMTMGEDLARMQQQVAMLVAKGQVADANNEELIELKMRVKSLETKVR